MMILDIFIKIGRYSRSWMISFFTQKISPEKFNKIYQETKSSYLETRDSYNYQDYIMPEWHENTIAIEKYFLDGFNAAFLRNKTIKKTMFMYTLPFWKNIQKKFIEKEIDSKIAFNILKESNIGKPLLNDWKYASSGNNIHHLYHLLKFFKETETDICDIETIVEVGGGYGNMAKIFKKLKPNSTYVIIDIPIFSYIQNLYLKTMLGTDATVILSKKNDNFKTGKVNIIPLDKNTIRDMARKLKNTDLFVSTWALSESNQKMQELIKELEYFSAKHILIAYQKSNENFDFAENVTDIHPEYRTIFNMETDYLKDNYYLFARRIN